MAAKRPHRAYRRMLLEKRTEMLANGLDYARLRLVDEALDRIRSGDYGQCLACEQPIPAKRLAAIPWARFCVPCQEAFPETKRPETALADSGL